MIYVIRVMNNSEQMNWMVHTSALIVGLAGSGGQKPAPSCSQALVDQHEPPVGRTAAGTDTRSGYSAHAVCVRAAAAVLLGDEDRLADRICQWVKPQPRAVQRPGAVEGGYSACSTWRKIKPCPLQERLRIAPSPMLWCCLGELENNDEHFRSGPYRQALRTCSASAGRPSGPPTTWKGLQCYLEF